MHCSLFADVTFSNEALAITVGLVGALWAWSVSLVQGRTSDLTNALRHEQNENEKLRRQNEGLYAQLLDSQRQVRALREEHPEE